MHGSGINASIDDVRVKHLVEEFVGNVQEILGENLIGIYLHGSLVMGCFNFDVSDIDILVVVDEKLSVSIKKEIAQFMIHLSKKSLPKGFEISIVLKKYLDYFEYPTPYEFHFSNDLIELYNNDEFDFENAAYDADLAAHFVIIKQRGGCLYGEDIQNIFPDVSQEYYLKSIISDFEWSFEKVIEGSDTGTGVVPHYAVLNACRVVAAIKDELITSKSEGGQWGIENFPEEYHLLIKAGLDEYKQQGSSKKVDTKLLKDYMIYCQNLITSEFE